MEIFPVKGSRRIPGYVSVLHEAVSLPGLPATGYSDSKDESVPSESLIQISDGSISLFIFSCSRSDWKS